MKQMGKFQSWKRKKIDIYCFKFLITYINVPIINRCNLLMQVGIVLPACHMTFLNGAMMRSRQIRYMTICNKT